MQSNKTGRAAALLLLFIFTLSFTLSLPACAEDGKIPEDQQKRVLFISSYAYSWTSVPRQIEGLEAELGNDYILNYEFMDTKNTVYSADYREFYELLRYKLSAREPYDAVVVGDDAALNFLLIYQNELFPETPVVFEGIDNLETARRAGESPWITGIVECVDYTKNIELAKRLMPEATRLVFILDNSENGAGIYRQLEARKADFAGYEVEYIDSSEYTRDDLAAKLEALDSGCIAFCLSMSQRLDGTIYTEDERYRLLESHVQVPLFRVSSSALDNCNVLLGGYVVAHDECGRRAGQMVREALTQNNISQIPVDYATPQVYCFNRRTIRRFGINTGLLPSGAVYLNEEPGFLQRHYLAVTVAAALTIIALLLVLLLGAQRGRRRQEALNARLDAGNEELNRRNRELEAKNAELARVSAYKSDFLSRVSHDLRTPMNTIVNLTKLVAGELDNPQAAAADLHKVDTSSQFMLSLINDILDMSLIEQKHIELHPERYGEDEFYNYLRSTFEPLCAEKKLHLTIERTGADVEVMTDKARFNQLCFNLLANAVKYTPGGGHVFFRMCCGAPREGQVPCDIYVTDDGIGMTAEFQERMFEPFTQEGRAFATVEGTGLGLSIVRAIAELFHAQIEVKSAPGQGTSFHISLQLALAPQQPPRDARVSAAEQLRGRHVLIAEDHPLNQEIIRRLLAGVGVVPTIAGNGQAALDAFRADPDGFDAILMDIRMPVMDGVTAARAIRSLPVDAAEHIPIIAVTANARAEDQAQTRAAGMNAHLDKPVNPALLYETLARFLNRGSTSPHAAT